MFVSDEILGKECSSASSDEIAKAKEIFLGMCFIQRLCTLQAGNLMGQLAIGRHVSARERVGQARPR